MLALVEHLAKSLVDQPDAVKVTQVDNGKEHQAHSKQIHGKEIFRATLDGCPECDAKTAGGQHFVAGAYITVVLQIVNRNGFIYGGVAVGDNGKGCKAEDKYLVFQKPFDFF